MHSLSRWFLLFQSRFLVGVLLFASQSLFASERPEFRQSQNQSVTQCNRNHESATAPKSQESLSNQDRFFAEMDRISKLNDYEMAQEQYSAFAEQNRGQWSVEKPGTATGVGFFQLNQSLFHRGLEPKNNDDPFYWYSGIYDPSMRFLMYRDMPQWEAAQARPNLTFTQALRTFFDPKIQFVTDEGWNLLANSKATKVSQSRRLSRNLHVLPMIKSLSLTDLYASYAHQGPERSKNLTRYQAQDADGEDRTTGFAFLWGPTAASEVLGHIQAKLSNGPHELHNFELNYGPIERPSHVKSVELGRLLLDLKGWDQRSGMVHLWVKHKAFNNFVRFSVYQKVLSWLSWDVQPDVVYSQVNTEKLERFMAPESPLVFSDVKPLKGSDGLEWLITMTPEGLRKSEEIVTLQVIKAQMESYLQYSDRVADHLLLKFDRNQFACLQRLGFLKFEKTSNPSIRFEENYFQATYSGSPLQISKTDLYQKPFLLIEFHKHQLDSLQSFLETQIKARTQPSKP